MAGETGGGGDLPLRAPLIPFPGWDLGPKWALFTSLGLFFSNCNSSIGSFGPFETLGDTFPRGPPRPSPLDLWNHFSSPGLYYMYLVDTSHPTGSTGPYT